MPNTDVVDLIMSDHREVERLFDIMTKEPATRVLHFPVVCSLLLAHSRAEETEVYPVAQQEAGESQEVAHSQFEHVEAEQLLEQMVDLEPLSAEFDEALKELIEAVTHHVQEEEEKVLPGIRTALNDERRSELGQAFADARAAHLGDRPGAATKEELAQQARNADLPGASTQSKEQLRATLVKEAESEEE